MLRITIQIVDVTWNNWISKYGKYPGRLLDLYFFFGIHRNQAVLKLEEQ
jgi:hypothetical protein